jgi:hypothetical protein
MGRTGKKAKDGTNRGRPTKFTPDLVRRLVLACRSGVYVETAAAMVGINKDTFYDWLRTSARNPGAPEWRVEFMDVRLQPDGSEELVPFAADFSDAIQMAQAEAEVRDWAIIGAAASTQWQAAAWRLERKHPHKYGRLVRQELTGAGGEPLLPEDGARARLATALAAAAARLADTDADSDGGS